MTCRFSLENRRLYLCTADRADLLEFVAACVDGGVDVVQLRDKQLDARHLVERATALRELCGSLGVPFFVNDRPDIALIVGADGVHVGQDDIAVRSVRGLVGDDMLIGLSTHSPRQFDEALTTDADYLSAGPVTPTPTKPGREGTGLDYVTRSVAKADRPVFVTGGVTPDSLPTIVAAGARHVVVVRYLTESSDPRGAAEKLTLALEHSLSAVES